MKQQAEKIWVNARLVTMADPAAPLAITDYGAVAMADGKILAAGPAAAVTAQYQSEQVIDLQGLLVTPGLIDCHTHLVYAGSRANEFEARLEGTSYADIAAQGGGIMSTLTSTRAASEQTLLDETLPRLDSLLAQGVTTVEIKSGYGQDIASELKQLRVARSLAQHRTVSVSPTLLAAHVVPPEFKGRADDYVSYVCEQLIPAALADGNIDAVDAFCEHIAFTPQQTSQIFDTARQAGLKVKLHAGQLSDNGSVSLAANYQALSADHIEFATAKDVEAMAASGTVAVLLPGAFYCLRETQKPPVELLRQHNIPMAVATDANPGTSPVTSPLLIMNMACTLFGLTVAEAFSGMTVHAAAALGQQSHTGSLEAGKYCDLACWDAPSPAHLIYQIGLNPLRRRIFRGLEK